MPNFQAIAKVAGLIFLTCVLLEWVWAKHQGQRVFQRGEVLANLGVFLGNQLLNPITQAWKFTVFSLVAPYQLWQIPVTPGTCVLTFFVVELVYYGYHRVSHEVPFMWAIHEAHHSSTHMNFTTAIRLNWMGGFVGPLAFVPVVLLGFSAKVVFICLLLGLVFQFFLHTQMIGTLGWFEGLFLNTPSAHRVHHGSNPQYLDKNYAAVFIFLDRIFGTWQPETEPVRFGVTTGRESPNPFTIVFGPMLRLLRRKVRKPSSKPLKATAHAGT